MRRLAPWHQANKRATDQESDTKSEELVAPVWIAIQTFALETQIISYAVRQYSAISIDSLGTIIFIENRSDIESEPTEQVSFSESAKVLAAIKIWTNIEDIDLTRIVGDKTVFTDRRERWGVAVVRRGDGCQGPYEI